MSLFTPPRLTLGGWYIANDGSPLCKAASMVSSEYRSDTVRMLAFDHILRWRSKLDRPGKPELLPAWFVIRSGTSNSPTPSLSSKALCPAYRHVDIFVTK